MELGETVTIAGIYEQVPNPARRWWQFWRPRFVAGPELRKFTITARTGTLTIPTTIPGPTR